MSETSTAQHEDTGQEAAPIETGVVDLNAGQDAEPVEDAAAAASGRDAEDSGEDAEDSGEDAEDSGQDAEDSGEDAEDSGQDAEDSDEDAEDSDEDVEDSDEEDSDDPLEAEGDIAADYLEDLLDIADLDGDIDTFTSGGRAHVSIVTTSEVLVGKDGEVLEALQELCRLAVMTETGRRSRLMLDVAGHRERRRKELQALAADAVAEVKESGEPVRLAPMNPFERKIVHDVVALAGLTSESEGEEPRRRVVVMTKKG